jgi:DNA-binding MarR family transcriptional regulator
MTMNRNLPLALRRAYLALHRRCEARFAPENVTADQFVLLATLARGKALTQRELARRMASDPSTVRAMLVLLERSGLVARETRPDDSRAKVVSLTAEGKRVFRKLWNAGQPIRASLLDVLGPGEPEILIELLTRIAEALEGACAPVGRSSALPALEDER